MDKQYYCRFFKEIYFKGVCEAKTFTSPSRGLLGANQIQLPDAIKSPACFPSETVCAYSILRQHLVNYFWQDVSRSSVAEVYAPSSVIGQQ